MGVTSSKETKETGHYGEGWVMEEDDFEVERQ